MVCEVGRTICRLLHLPFSSRFLLNGTGTRFRLNGTGWDGNVTVFVPPTVSMCIVWYIMSLYLTFLGRST